MDINPKRTLATVGISLLIGGGILYFQYNSYSPGTAIEAKKGAENIKKMSAEAEIIKPELNEEVAPLAMPEVAEGAVDATPPPLSGVGAGIGVLASLPSFDNEQLGPRMKEALQNKTGISPPNSGGRSSQPSGGGTSGGGTSGGGEDGEEAEYWIDATTETRHNSSCELYKTSEGRVGTKDEGTPCRLCGG